MSLSDDGDSDKVEEVTDSIQGCHLNDSVGSSFEQEDDVALPRVLIVTCVPDAVFDEDEARVQFEMLFREFDATVEFCYLKSFRRARVAYDSPNPATRARIQLHEHDIFGSTIKCYFAQPVDADESTSSAPFLCPPKPDKQFLISPPTSPPVGWESCNEKEPVINFDLIAAITNLAPGEAHEIHKPAEGHPGIVIHVCEDPEGYKDRPAILQTRCPNAI